MNADEMRDLVADYNRSLPEDTALEGRLTRSIQKNGYLTKHDLSDVIRWKFSGDGQKRTHFLKVVARAEDEHVKELSRAALSMDSNLSDLGRMKILDELPAVGTAVASVIMTFWNPTEFGVYDYHAWDAVAAEGLVKREQEGTPDEYVNEYLPALREVASRTRMSVREVEKAYYWKDASPKRAQA